MKHVRAVGVFCLLFCLLFAVAASAATLTIGRANFTYTVPVDCCEANEEPYLSLRHSAAAAAPAMRIHSLYIERQAHERFSARETPFPDSYFFLASLPDLDKETISVADFARIKEGLAAAKEELAATPDSHETSPQPAGNSKDDETLNGVGKPSWRPSWGGIFEETDTSLSFLLLSEQTLGDEAFTLRQAAVSSYLLVGGTVVAVIQYRSIDPAGDVPAQLDDFKRQALERVRQLDISAASSGIMNGPFGKALFGGLIGALIGFTVMWVRNKLEERKRAVL